MKMLKTGAICVLICLCTTGAHAQQPPPLPAPDIDKPRLFADLPPKISLDVQLAEAFLKAEPGQAFSLPVGPGHAMPCVVVSKSDAADTETQTVVARLTNRPGAALTLTRTRAADGRYRYRGRVLSFKHGDAYDLTYENGQLLLVKTDRQELINE